MLSFCWELTLTRALPLSTKVSPDKASVKTLHASNFTSSASLHVTWQKKNRHTNVHHGFGLPSLKCDKLTNFDQFTGFEKLFY
jgi:hypothetical protein